jgi:branched-chain amino acid transport system substrate-binding protein
MSIVVLLSIGTALPGKVPGISKDTILIGSPGWYTGPGAGYTVPIQQGYLLAAKEINNTGGIYGRKIKILIEDTGYSPKQSIAVVNRFVQKDKVFSLLGADVTANMWAMLPIITKSKIPLVETMSSTTILAAPFNKYTFRTMLNHWYQAWLSADLAAGHFNHKRIALFNITDTWGTETIKAVKIRLKERWGLDPVVHAEVPKTATDVGASVIKIKEANPDALISVGWPRNITPLLRQSYELGLKVNHIGTSAADYTEMVMAGKYARGHISHLITKDLVEGNDPDMRAFREKFKREYPDVAKLGRPGMWDAVGYATMHLVAAAMKNAGPDLTREKFIAELEKMHDYRSIWTPLKFSSSIHDGIHAMKFFKVIGDNGEREIITGLQGNSELLRECLERSLKVYVPNLKKDYLKAVGY